MEQKNYNFSELGYEGLKVYRLAFQLAMQVFELTKSFPREETYSLTDQVRRSSRSVCANIGEGYRKRVYSKSFVTRMVDADGECSETMIHLKFANACKYVEESDIVYFAKQYDEVGRMLNTMIQNPERFLPKKISNGTIKS